MRRRAILETDESGVVRAGWRCAAAGAGLVGWSGPRAAVVVGVPVAGVPGPAWAEDPEPFARSAATTYQVTFAARACAAYAEVMANQVRDDAAESPGRPGQDSPYKPGQAVEPGRRGARRLRAAGRRRVHARQRTGEEGRRCRPSPAPASPVTTLADTPRLDAAGRPTGGPLRGAVTVTLTEEQVNLAGQAATLGAGRHARGAGAGRAQLRGAAVRHRRPHRRQHPVDRLPGGRPARVLLRLLRARRHGHRHAHRQAAHHAGGRLPAARPVRVHAEPERHVHADGRQQRDVVRPPVRRGAPAPAAASGRLAAGRRVRARRRRRRSTTASGRADVTLVAGRERRLRVRARRRRPRRPG